MSRVLLLGADGFVGRHISEHLLSRGVDLRCIGGKRELDLRHEKDRLVCELAQDVQVVVNCAAHVGSLKYVTENAATVYMDNVEMTSTLYRAISAIRTPPKIVNIIANCIYDSEADLLKETDILSGTVHHSVFSYGMTRRHLIAASRCLHADRRINTINLVCPNMYGPHDSDDPSKAHAINALAAKFVRASELGSKYVEVGGSGRPIREWLYAGDVARLIYDCMQQEWWHDETYLDLNVAQQSGVSISEVVEMLRQEVGTDINPNYLSEYPDGASRKVMYKGKFVDRFPNFEFTPMKTGISNTIDFYRRHVDTKN